MNTLMPHEDYIVLITIWILLQKKTQSTLLAIPLMSSGRKQSIGCTNVKLKDLLEDHASGGGVPHAHRLIIGAAQ